MGRHRIGVAARAERNREPNDSLRCCERESRWDVLNGRMRVAFVRSCLCTVRGDVEEWDRPAKSRFEAVGPAMVIVYRLLQFILGCRVRIWFFKIKLAVRDVKTRRNAGTEARTAEVEAAASLEALQA